MMPTSALRTPDSPRADTRAALLGGGTDGNEQLTAMTGVTLLVLLGVLGVTILRIGQLISVHLFVGFLLIGPIAVKLSSVGYRFARYYAHNRDYRAKGPPQLAMRLIAPMVVLWTAVVFVSGVVLMLVGPRHREPSLTVHKVSFIVWLVFTAAHVLGHLPALPRSLRAAGRAELGAALATPGMPTGATGAAGRWLALAGAVVGGLVVAFVLMPSYAPWTVHGALIHHHHGG